MASTIDNRPHSDLTVKVLIVCDEEERYTPWVHVFLNSGASEVFIKRKDDAALVINQATMADNGRVITWHDIPPRVTAVLVHVGDKNQWRYDVTACKVFWFDAPGSPSVSGDGKPILRPTSTSNFRITETDAREIIEYSTGARTELPTCCRPEQEQEWLPALEMLCEGYLAIFDANHKSQPHSSAVNDALESMRWADFGQALQVDPEEKWQEVTQADWWQKVIGEAGPKKAVTEEWGAAQAEDGFEDVMRLIAAIEGNGLSAPDMVAKAYCALSRHLNKS